MIYTVLLFVFAAMLFALSSVLGTLGWISGAVVALVAVVWTSISLGHIPEVWILIGLWVAALIGVAYYNTAFKREATASAGDSSKDGPDQRAKYQEIVDTVRQTWSVKASRPSGVSDEYRKAYESIQFRQNVKQDLDQGTSQDRAPSGSERTSKVEHDFSTYSRDIPPEIAARKFCRNHTEVAGLQMRRADALRYIEGAVAADVRGQTHGLRLDREPTNAYDSNAIRVTGWWGSQRAPLGHVPRDLAAAYARIADNGGELFAVPKRAYRGHDDYVDIRFVIYGIEPT